MTNPNDQIGCNAGYSGRTSPDAFNDVAQALSGRGVLSGFECSPSSGLTVVLGGSGTSRDVAIAEDDTGNYITINNRTTNPIAVQVDTASATLNRVDSIVAYVTKPLDVTENPPSVDNPTLCGIIPVSGTAGVSPSAPNDSQIRAAISADGGSGTTAYYVVLADVYVAAGATDITSANITNGAKAVSYPGFEVDSAIDAASTNPVENKVVTAAAVGVMESFSIADTDWGSLVGAAPFVCQATVLASTPINANTQVELYNDQAVLFANHGFAIASVSGQNITLYAVEQPTSSVTLNVNFKETE